MFQLRPDFFGVTQKPERHLRAAWKSDGQSASWQYRQGANPSENPIFVVGIPRLGTTLTESILDTHRKYSGPESQTTCKTCLAVGLMA